MALERSEFDDNLRRWYHADRLSPAQVQRLWDYWQEVNADNARLVGIERLLRPENRIGVGLAWWEDNERAIGEGRTKRFTDLGVLNTLLTANPPGDVKPVPRLHTPTELVGTWRAIGLSRDDQQVEPVTDRREWRLGADGALATSGDPDRDGWHWRVNLQKLPSRPRLLLGPPGEAARESWTLLRQAGKELDLVPPGNVGGFLRWRRQ